MDYSRMMHSLALRFADRPAIENIERDRSFTFVEYHELTNRFANALRRDLGLRRGDVYVNILNNDSLSLVHQSAILKGEATCAWTNYRDSLAEHLWQVDFVDAKVVLLENELLEDHYEPLRERGVRIVCMDPLDQARDDVHSFWDLVESADDSNPGVEHSIDEDVVLLRFTGGTTGKGKCAAYTSRQLFACRDSFLSILDLGFDRATRFLHIAPLSHGSAMPTLPTLFQGGCTVTQNLPDLEQYAKNIQDRRVTASFCVPTMLYRLLEIDAPGRYDLSSLRAVMYGAAPMSPARLVDLQKAFGNIFVQVYGATEHFCAVSCLEKDDHLDPDEDRLIQRLGSCGRISPNVEFKVVDEQGKESPVGEIGEFWHRSDAIIPRYYKNPEVTAEEFSDGWWKSGDLGYLDAEGYAYIVDRKKDMIITGGFNVYAVEVEAALNAHPAILMSAVVGIPHADWGEAVHAEVVLREGAKAEEVEIVEFAKARIGRHKAPKSVAFVSEVPLSAVGKMLRRVVREKYWQESDRGVN